MNVTGINASFTVSKGNITNEQWDAARPLIQRLYIDENKSFSYVANVLKTEYGFCPTKRQFDRKVSAKWALRKHTCIKERLLAVRQLELSIIDPAQTSTTAEKIDQRRNATKLKRWKRELEKCSMLDINSDHLMLSNQSAPVSESSTQLLTTTNIGSNSTTLEVFNFRKQPNTIQDSSHLADSPSLDDLLSEFHISGFNLNDKSIPLMSLFSLDNSLVVEEKPTCFTAADLIELQAPRRDSKDVEPDSVLLISALVPCRYSRDRVPSSRFQGTLDLLNHRNMYTVESPCNELYVFPSSSPISSRAQSKSCQLSPSFSEEKLQKLTRVLPHHHNLVLRTMEDLSLEYMEHGLYSQAMPLYRTLLSAMVKSVGLHHPKALSARLNLVDCLQLLHHSKEAREINYQLRTTIATVCPTNYDLLCRSMSTLFCDTFSSGRHAEGEQLLRELLQIKLNLYGPRDEGTIRVMIDLGKCIERRGSDPHSAEQILRLAVQVVDQVPNVTKIDTCEYLRRLAACLNNQDMRDEAGLLFAHVRSHASSMIPETHPAMALIELDFATYLANGGDYVRSCDVLREMIAKRGLGGAETDAHTLALLSRLARHLESPLGRFEEACGWFEKAVPRSTALYGIESCKTLRNCHGLGTCYREMGQHRKALELFEDTRRKLKASERKFDSKINSLDREIMRCEKILAEEQSSLG